jgi:hypothetical protein
MPIPPHCCPGRPTVGDSIRSATALAGHSEPDVDHILRLAAIIREVDGGNRLGAAALAEAILAHPDCDMALYAQPLPSSPVAAAQAEEPSLADVVKLCQEFFHIADPNNPAFAIVHEMITAAITRWPAPGLTIGVNTTTD